MNSFLILYTHFTPAKDTNTNGLNPRIPRRADNPEQTYDACRVAKYPSED